MRYPILLFVLVLFSCSENKKKKEVAENIKIPNSDSISIQSKIITGSTLDSPGIFREEYYKDAPTNSVLYGGYITYFVKDSTTNYMYIKKEGNIRLLCKQENMTSCDNMGKVIRDFEQTFLLGHDNGNGCPYTYELIDKKTLKNLLGSKVSDINSDNIPHNYLAFVEFINNSYSKCFYIYNVNNHKKEQFKLPKEIIESEYFNYSNLWVDTLADNKVAISYNLGDSMPEYHKVYFR